MRNLFFLNLVLLTLIQGCGGGSSGKKTSGFSEFVDELELQPEADANRMADALSQDIYDLCGKRFPKVDAYLLATRDQGHTGMCGGMSALRTLEDNQRKRGQWKEKLSLLHFASLGDKGDHVALQEGVGFELSFERIQQYKKMRTESDLPFDLELFSQANALKFTEFFKTGLSFNMIEGKHYTIDGFESDMQTWKKESATLEKFNDKIKIPLSYFKKKKSMAEKWVPVEPFNYRTALYRKDVVNDGIKFVLNTVLHNRIATIGICAARLPEVAERIKEKGLPPGECGGHAVNILSARKTNNSCEVLVGNSWGDKWGDKGNRWVDIKDVARSVGVWKREGVPLLLVSTLHDRKKDVKVANEIYGNKPGEEYVGQTDDGEYQGEGQLTRKSENSTAKLVGTFEEDVFVNGTKTTYDSAGEIRTIESGKFNHAERLVEGTQQEIQSDGTVSSRDVTVGGQ